MKEDLEPLEIDVVAPPEVEAAILDALAKAKSSEFARKTGQAQSVLEIDYESEGFEAGALVANGPAKLTTSWNELLWAAITIGRPPRYDVFKHGVASSYEALFRLSLVRMALEQSRPRAKRLRRTAAARSLDPSEKGAVNYFLGLSVCKLFASQLLNAPWLLHLDTFGRKLRPKLTGRSRPDLVGETTTGQLVALECKGRVSAPDNGTKTKAKAQAQRLVSAKGDVPDFQIGGIAYLRHEVLQFYWRDPEPDPNVKNPIEFEIQPDMWRYYYAPTLDLIRSDRQHFQLMLREPTLMSVEGADVQVGIHPEVLRSLADSQWEEARKAAQRASFDAVGHHYQVDGIAVLAGESWLRPFEEAQG